MTEAATAPKIEIGRFPLDSTVPAENPIITRMLSGKVLVILNNNLGNVVLSEILRELSHQFSQKVVPTKIV